jgi:hypothetical protein
MKDTPIIMHATTDAATDNLLIRFSFIYDTTFLHPTHLTQKPVNDFHISLRAFLNKHIHR